MGGRETGWEAALLAVDVGNTTTRLGVFHDGEIAGTWELTTLACITADEAYAQVVRALEVLGVDAPRDAMLACVVPSLADAWYRALARACSNRVYVVGPGLKTGIRMRYDDPSEVGADRVADAVAARDSYGAPVLVVDLGTTTNIEVIDGSGAFAGGVIAPGIALRAPACVIGRNTRAAMQSGVVLGEVARIDGLLDAVMGELGEPAPVVVTGDGAESLASLLAHEVVVDDTLTLRGLHAIWATNARRGQGGSRG